MALRVHYVLVRFPKLSETFVLRELLELERAGWGVSVDALESPLDEPRDPELARLRARVRQLPAAPRPLRLSVTHAGLAARRPLAWLRSLGRARREGRVPEFLRAGLIAARARRERADLIHVHFAYYAAEYARDAGELAGIPFTVYAHANDIWAEFNAPHLARRVHPAAGVATGTAYNVDRLRAASPGTEVVHLPLGVDVPLQASAAADGPVLAVGRLVEKKGFDTLVKACAHARAGGRELRAEVIGDGPLLGALRELAGAHGVEDVVTFRGARGPDEVTEAYGRCSVVAVPSRVAADGDRDGLPTVLLEAMARGLPVVSTHVAGIPELLRDGENGLLVPPDDPGALAEALLRIRDASGLAARLGAAGRRTVDEGYTLAARSRDLRAWLERCARSP